VDDLFYLFGRGLATSDLTDDTQIEGPAATAQVQAAAAGPSADLAAGQGKTTVILIAGRGRRFVFLPTAWSLRA
jgi:hypothetical protein